MGGKGRKNQQKAQRDRGAERKVETDTSLDLNTDKGDHEDVSAPASAASSARASASTSQPQPQPQGSLSEEHQGKQTAAYATKRDWLQRMVAGTPTMENARSILKTAPAWAGVADWGSGERTTARDFDVLFHDLASILTRFQDPIARRAARRILRTDKLREKLSSSMQAQQACFARIYDRNRAIEDMASIVLKKSATEMRGGDSLSHYIPIRLPPPTDPEGQRKYCRALVDVLTAGINAFEAVNAGKPVDFDPDIELPAYCAFATIHQSALGPWDTEPDSSTLRQLQHLRECYSSYTQTLATTVHGETTETSAAAGCSPTE